MPLPEQDRRRRPVRFQDLQESPVLSPRVEVEANKPIITEKFGGTSVGNAERIVNISNIILQHHRDGAAVVVVVSAMSGVTNLLVDLSNEDMVLADREKTIRAIIDKHSTTATELRLFPDRRHALTAELNVLYRMLRGDVEDMSLHGKERADRILSYGERLSARLVATQLLQRGVRAHAFDSTSIIATDDQFGEAKPDMEATKRNAELRVVPLIRDGIVPVITGFLGGTKEEKVTTLGRGGSDFSASIIGRAVGACEVWIWTDVDGVYDKDPRNNPDARIYSELTFEQADAMAKAGAKVLHAKTLEPLSGSSITLFVKNSFKPDYPGTKVLPSKSEAD